MYPQYCPYTCRSLGVLRYWSSVTFCLCDTHASTHPEIALSIDAKEYFGVSCGRVVGSYKVKYSRETLPLRVE